MRQQLEHAVGAIIYSPKRRAFLVLKHRDGHWEFPKGKVEPGESAEDARDREVLEETGLIPHACLEFSFSNEYYFFRQGNVKKTVEYGLMLSDGEVTISSEHRGHVWLPYGLAQKQLHFANHRKALRAAAEKLVRSGRIIPGFSL